MPGPIQMAKLNLTVTTTPMQQKRPKALTQKTKDENVWIRQNGDSHFLCKATPLFV
jgi:hypothetical protein